MTNALNLIAYFLINTLILNISIKAGWGHDPGLIGPLLISIQLNMIAAVFASVKSKQ